MTSNASVPALSTPQIIGCDVGKSTITVFDTATGRTGQIANHADALCAFAQDLPPDCLVICEATGGYETGLLLAAMEAGIPVHRADARKVKAFIRSRGTLGKSDGIDARGLARYGQERHAELPRWQPAGGMQEKIRTLTRLRTQLVKQRTALSNQIKAPGGGIAKKHLGALYNAACRQISAIEADIRELIERDPATAKVLAIINAIPGCGYLTAVTVVALMPELGAMSGRQAASLAGLAPHPHQSGQRDGYRRTRGGRPEIKRPLFMAARNHNPALKAVYERLIHNGKKPLVAITALMRKLIIINARVRDSLYAPAQN